MPDLDNITNNSIQFVYSLKSTWYMRYNNIYTISTNWSEARFAIIRIIIRHGMDKNGGHRASQIFTMKTQFFVL